MVRTIKFGISIPPISEMNIMCHQQTGNQFTVCITGVLASISSTGPEQIIYQENSDSGIRLYVKFCNDLV